MSLSNTVSSPQNRDTLQPMEQLAASQKSGLELVNRLIIERMQSDVPLIPTLAGHLIAGGGKRIRPLLTLASAALFGYQGPRTHKLAACVEFIHTATLLHDDVVDESDQRRGKASANALFGNEAAVLVGDFLFSRSFQLMVEDGSLDVLRVLSNASAVIAEGEVLQLSTANNLSTTEEQYLKVIAAKTAALFAAACETGAIAAGRGAEDCKRLKDYGFYLGMAFQISDDVLDYAADEKILGKTLGDDFREGKMTLPVIYAIQKASAEERIFWQRCLSDQNQNDSDFAQALALLRKENIFEKCLIKAKSYAALASEALDAYPASDLRHHLQDLAIFAADRDY